MAKKAVLFRFYEELNDFLPPVRRKTDFNYEFFGRPTVKDCIEAIGVPHTEVDLILVDGSSVGFDYHIREGERISVYPVFESLDISPVMHLRPQPLRTLKFICDVHLGKLARQLRMLGFDVLYDKDITNSEIIAESLQQQRIILTRDQGLLKHTNVTRGYWIRSTQSKDQLIEINHRFDLKRQIKPFTVCMVCNGKIVSVPKEKITRKVPPRILRHFDVFFTCVSCHKIYWKGSHYTKMERKVEQLLLNQ